VADPARVRLSPKALADLEDIWLYTSRTWSIDQADTYVSDMFAVMSALASGDRRGRPVEARPGYLKYPAGSHLLFFRLSERRIDVIRILHSRMDAPSHL
jgi:toxin ParE1/3/4